MSEGPDVRSGLASGPAPRYALFGGDTYDEAGGWRDMIDVGNDVGDLVLAFADLFTLVTAPATPGGWVGRFEILSTTPTDVIVNGVLVPGWSRDAPDDAPPRPGGDHFWYPARPAKSHWSGPDWGHIVDLTTKKVVYVWEPRSDVLAGPGVWGLAPPEE